MVCWRVNMRALVHLYWDLQGRPLVGKTAGVALIVDEHGHPRCWLLRQSSGSRTRNPSKMRVRASSVCCAACSPGRSRIRNGSVLFERNSIAVW